MKFIEKSLKLHDSKYDYSLVNYINSRTKVEIICKKHGIFKQEPANHLRGQGCPKCAGVNKLTKQEFIKKSQEIHDKLYDYSLVEYINNKTEVKIICSKHGEFETRPDQHIYRKSGCPKCANNIIYSTFEFIQKANIVHNNKFDYSKTKYITAHDKIIIICPIHGEFIQKPNTHLLGCGCSKCSQKYSYSNIEYIEKVKIIHNNKYDYSLTNYETSSKIKIICPKHGIFEQNAKSHLNGTGCPMCFNEKRTYNTKKFIELSKIKHGDFFDYSLVKYEHSSKKVKIICPKHGIFEQNPNNHIRGAGCPYCRESHGEKIISTYLENNNIEYIRQYVFKNCKNKKNLPFDFYLHKYNICIEYDGMQHFKPITYFGGMKTLIKIKYNDNIKNEYCQNNNIKLVRIKYNQNIVLILDKILK